MASKSCKLKLGQVFLILTFIFTFAIPLTQAEIDHVELTLFQGDLIEISLEKILGFKTEKAEINGINFLKINSNKGILDIDVSVYQEPGIYVGIISADNLEIPLVVSVSNRNIPFKIDITMESERIETGSDLNFYVSLNMASYVGQISAPMNYEIRKLYDNLVLKEQKGKIITTESSEIVLDGVEIPLFMDEGEYMCNIKIFFSFF